MADRGRGWRPQHSHETRALSYGHFGTATYDSRAQTWVFLRQNQPLRNAIGVDDPTNTTGFHLVHEQVVSTQAARKPQFPDALNPSRSVGRTGLLKQLPEAALLSRFLPTAQVSRDQDFDQAVLGNTLALGTARASSRKSQQYDSPSCMVLFFRGGACNEDIHLAEIEAEEIDIPMYEISCKLPTISSDRGSHIKSTEPVRHISSADTLSGRFLVLKESGTSIFELLWRQRHVSELETEDSSHRNATLVDQILLLAIPSTRTGEAAHAHASFQTGNQGMLAIVDVNGQWSTWEIRRKRSALAPVPCHATLQYSNNIYDAISEPERVLVDDWHRICWLPDTGQNNHRILVCNRRVAAVFGGDGTLEGHVDMRLGPPSNETQILDVRTSSVRPYLVLALTSSRLLIFTSQGLVNRGAAKYEPLELVCSWAHFRHGSDLSLRMSVAEFEQDTFVLLYSPSSDIAIMYHIGHGPSDSETLSLRDPAMFNLPTEVRARMSGVTDIALYPVDFDTVLEMSKPPFQFMKLVASTSQGIIIEALYRHRFQQPGDGKVSIELPGLCLPNRQVISTAHVARSDLAELGDFVVDDDAEKRQTPLPKGTVTNVSLSVSPLPCHTHDWKAIFEMDRFRLADDSSIPFSDSLDIAIRYFENLQLQQRRWPIQVFSNLVHQHHISDVEQDSEATTIRIAELVRRDDLRLDSAGLDGLSALSSEQNLLDLYQLGLLSYVASLGEKVTDRNRVNRERLVRHLAGEVFLGNIIVRSIHPSDQSMELTLPSSPPEPQSGDTPTTTPLPTVSPNPVAEEEPAVTRLRTYVSFREQVPPFQASDQENISNIVAHLPDSIDEDPAHYSYQNTNQRLKLIQEEVAAQSLDPRERRKAARQAARLQKRLEKSVRIGQEIMSQRNMLPDINSIGRGAGFAGREVQSSQPGVGGSSQGPSQSQGIPGLTMTQPERGAFGTRPSKSKGKGKDKGSKRKAGF
ncbi:hypothetical protein PV08_08555 [Exophiala spinifera]|uniref:RNA polymerase I-specific transcription initiation factor RRN6-like protein n=1 Tax=Exophiala spinifera TaxID=91928 RepID=A0A0D1ZKL2_9EURO|nr:uncharacterized protein PV08_08555 [Exophiala spinifera]KIW13367.1 hypothetical protein PV08_08555 [Exophiala spinifera]